MFLFKYFKSRTNFICNFIWHFFVHTKKLDANYIQSFHCLATMRTIREARVQSTDLSIKILQITKGTQGVAIPRLFTWPAFKAECNTIRVIFIIQLDMKRHLHPVSLCKSWGRICWAIFLRGHSGQSGWASLFVMLFSTRPINSVKFQNKVKTWWNVQNAFKKFRSK